MSSSPQCCASATSTLVPATLRALRYMNLWRCEMIMDVWRTGPYFERRTLEFPWKNSDLFSPRGSCRLGVITLPT